MCLIAKIPIRSSKKEIEDFLIELREILDVKYFDINRNFLLIRSHRSHGEHHYSTSQTLIDLDYAQEDVVARLRELSVSEYYETLLDRDDEHPPYLFVFAKNINGRQVYIKIKIKEGYAQKVLCVSFHFAQYEMIDFPYAR